VAAVRRRRRPKPSKLALSPRLQAEVEAGLKLLWSPKQISAWLKREHSDDPLMQISHETIYISLYVQGRGTLRKELTKLLRTQRTYRRAKNEIRPRGPRKIPNPIMISQRPAEAADRAVPGHWEGDQGSEMAQHERFTVDTGVAVYFCDPGSPWQRGTSENTNGLLRQYFPKGRSLAGVTQAELDLVAAQMNERPRETLGWRTPAEALSQLLKESPSAGGATTH
jgi:IS30 family transposase